MTPPATRRIEQGDLDSFADLSGDRNPIHTDPAFAAATPFRRPVAHGMFLFALLIAHVERRWPGREVGQFSLMFPAPTPVGARVEFHLEPGPEGPAGLPVRVAVALAGGGQGLRGEILLAGDPGGTASSAAAAEELAPAAPGSAGGPAPRGETHGQWWASAVGRAHAETEPVTPAHVAAYEELTGSSAGTGVPAGLIAGRFSKILGMDLPGEGTNYLKQQLTMCSPARVGEQLTTAVEVERVRADKQLVYLATTCRGADGRTVARGTALVLARGKPLTDRDSSARAGAEQGEA